MIWLGSIVIHLQGPKNGIDMDNIDYKRKLEDDATRYAISKTGDLYIGCEWARRDRDNGVMHLVSCVACIPTPLL